LSDSNLKMLLFYPATSVAADRKLHALSGEFHGTLLLRSSPKLGKIKGKQRQL